MDWQGTLIAHKEVVEVVVRVVCMQEDSLLVLRQLFLWSVTIQ
jgi:hypothetical protein